MCEKQLKKGQSGIFNGPFIVKQTFAYFHLPQFCCPFVYYVYWWKQITDICEVGNYRLNKMHLW